MTEIKSAHEALSKIIEANAEEEAEEVKKEDIEKLVSEGVKKALEPIVTKLEAVEKNADPAAATQEQPELTAADVTSIVAEAVTKAVEPLSQRLEKVETARGITKQVETEPAQSTPVVKGYMDYLK